MQKSENPYVLRIAKTAGKSAGQVLVRYSVQKGWVPLPKSDKEHRIHENADVFDFEISPEDMAALDRREKDDGKLSLCQDVSLL
jgi:diketogulonate reductase-like aldo/keto reductase